ncbi:MAG: type IV secretion system protein [Alphaproteobacteria bacterium]
MLKINLSIYNNKYNLILILCLALFLITSCTGNGCVEADDYGEFENQLLEVYANTTENSCKFDTTKLVNDTQAQGAGMVECLSKNQKTLDGQVYTGCSKVSPYSRLYECFSICYNQCLVDLMKNSLNTEPSWIATNSVSSGLKPSITIYPDSQISIKVQGNVKLGKEIYSAYFPTDSRNSVYDTIKLDSEPSATTYNKYFIDLNSNSPTYLNIYGNWIDTADPSPDTGSTRTIGPGTSSFYKPPIGVSLDSTSSSIINGLKRLLIYAIPHPEGYSLKTSCLGEIVSGSTNKESNCILGMPLLADPRVWTCSYPSASVGSPATSATCTNSTLIADNYRSFYGSSKYSANEINSYYPVSNNAKLTQLGTYGGFIRWTGDGLKQTSFDPFVRDGVSCVASGNCSNLETMDQYLDGRIIGNISSGNVEITNRNNFAKRVYFRSLAPDTTCQSGYSINVTNLDPRSVSYNTLVNIPITTSWSNQFVDLEPNGGKFSIQANVRANTSGVNCGNFLAIKYIPFHDIVVSKSGYVKFTNVRGSGPCTVNARIINTSAPDQTYYEFATDTQDPLSTINVPWSSSYLTMSWSSEVFIRKNQTIRFIPTSWNGSFATPSGFAQCGIGMAMYITPRPAVLCKGTITDYNFNSRCQIDYDSTNAVIGCKPYSVDCEDPNQASYCPSSSNCQFKLANCINGSETTAKTGCTAPNTETIGTCTYNSSITSAKCTACSTKLLEATREVPKYSVANVDACFDLENYTGRASDVTTTANQIPGSLSNKGLKFLENFNGYYGSLWPTAETTQTESGSNIVHQAKNPIVTTQNSRLVFSFLDGANFLQTNTATANNSGTFKIKLGNPMNFRNGEWLQIKLCSDSGNNCTGTNPTQVSGQGNISMHSTPTTDITRQISNYDLGNYKFDYYGNILRYTAPNLSYDCYLNGIVTQAGSNFYCHVFESRTTNDLNAMNTAQKQARQTNIEKLRLSFKIFDPEQTTCYYDKPTNLGGLPYNGVSPPFDGILIDNPDGDSSSPSTSYCDKKTFANGGTCTFKSICVNPYNNNSGKYDVLVSVKSAVNNNTSKIISGIVRPFSEIFDGYTIGSKAYPGETERLYRNLINHPQYIFTMKFALVLMFIFYGIGYLMGISELNQSEIVMRFFKIGMIFLFTSEAGWEWYKLLVVRLFKDGTDFLAFSFVSNFDDSPEILSAIGSNNFSDKGLLFRSVDKVLNIAFSDTVSKKVSSFLFSNFFGWAYLLIFYFGILKYVYAVATTVMLFLTAKFFMSILFVVGPIFILFTLFNQTKDFFDRWLKYMISFSIQQILIASTMAFFSLLLYEIIKLILSFKICWEEIWVINFPFRISLMSFWTISNVPKSTFIQAGSYSAGSNQSIPSLFSIMFFWLVSSMMKHMISYMDTLATALGGGLQSSTLGSGLKSAAMKIKNTAKDYGKKYMNKGLKETGLDNAVARLDNYLFDSGKLAKQKRKKTKADGVKNSMNQNEMKDAGKQAINDYKKNNAEEISKMPEKERETKLKEVRDQAMKDKGKELGLDDNKIKDIMNKGAKFSPTSRNTIVAGAQYLAHKVQSARGKNQGLGNEAINDTSLSESDVKSAIKGMESEKRADFINDLKNNPNDNKDKLNIDKLEKYADRQNRKDEAGDKKESDIGAKLARMKVGAGDKIASVKQKAKAVVNAVKNLFK